MRFQRTLSAISLAASTLASPYAAEERVIQKRTTADVYNTINLEDFEGYTDNTTALDKRVDWAWCARNGNTATCVNTGIAIINTIVLIANGIKAKSNAKSCSYESGTVEDAQYTIHATGSNCDTTATEKTIEGGLNTYFQAHGGAVCDVHCVKQTHGGTYTGYLLIAPEGTDISSVTCDSSVTFPNDCGSGGEKDAP